MMNSNNISNKTYLEVIEANLQEPIDTYTIIDKGWTNLVFDINNKWIFRFAKHAGSKQINIEKDFLAKFAKLSPIDIPNPLIVSEENKLNTLEFIAYPKIQGEKLSKERLQSFTEKELTQFYKSLGDFLSQLHQFEYTHKHLLAYPYGGSEFWTDLWPVVEPRLKKESKEKAFTYFTETIELFEECPVHKIAVNKTPIKTLSHSDLGTNNILLSSTSNQLAGIIDFGDIALADPAVDFSSFYRHFGQKFVENILEHYSAPYSNNSSGNLSDDFMLRVDYQSKRKLFFVAYFALNYGYEKSLPKLINLIESIF